MKRLIRKSKTNINSSSVSKLKRTPESGHDYSKSLIFNTVEEYIKWRKEDEKYED